MEMVSIKISARNKGRIEALKRHPRETIDDVVSSMLDRSARKGSPPSDNGKKVKAS